MRISQTVIRGDRPITRFAPPTGNPRERHLGLRRATPARLAHQAAALLASRPTLAIRRAARGHLGVDPIGIERARIDALRRSDAMSWSQPAESAPHRARSRSATPWRG